MSQADIAKAQEAVARAQAELASSRATRRPDSPIGIRQEQQAYQKLVAAQQDLQRVQQAAAGTPPANSVDPAVSPVANQLEGFVAEEYGIPANFAEVAEPLPPSFDEQLNAFLNSEEPDPIPEPQITPSYAASPTARQTTVSQLDATENALNSLEALPTQQRLQVQTQIDALRNQREQLIEEARAENSEPEPVNPAEDPFADGADVNVTEETIVPIRENLNPEPVLATDPIVNDFDEFAQEERDLQNPDGNTKRVATPVNDQQAQDQQQVPRTVENTAANEDIITVEEQQAQINNAALDRLRKQSAAQQQREPEGTGDWRVKLRLASGANYFYNQPVNGPNGPELGPGILAPLAASDGIVFPYTPSIQILYAADYNQYHPTHSNYQHYFYKGSKVGEVVLTATFTAQDTVEANYLLAVIHFLKSASKMFYGQDAQRGSPPPLLFLTGLGDYQFNEAPCVISQFNYVLPNDVDYIRANVEGIRAGETLQTNVRNKNNGSTLATWSASINRILNSPGLTIGAENTTSGISGKTANLGTKNATYVPTKLEMTITLLPVQNRLQVSEQFSLKEYANGKLIQRGFW